MASTPLPRSTGTPVTIPASSGARWIVGTLVFAFLLIYLIGIDQGATSILGNDMHIHEFVHDARHLLGFPCH
jgi:hypothetical protein